MRHPLRAKKAVILALAAAVVSAGALESAQAVGVRPTATVRPAVGSPTTPITHVIIVLKENRSFDQYFGRFPGVDGATTGKLHNGKTIALGPGIDPPPNDINHNYQSFELAYDNGKNDGFDLEQGAFTADGRNFAYTSMEQSQIPNYWHYAETYAIGDRMFAAAKGPSFGNNLFAVAGQAGQYDSQQGGRSANSLPSSIYMPKVSPWGCDSPSDTLADLMDSSGNLSEAFPCFNFTTMPNLLQNAHISWAFYGAPGDRGFAHNALDALSKVRDNPSLWQNIHPFAQFMTDAKNGRLPAVTWITPTENEHPPRSACAGESEFTQMMDDLMQGSDWSSSAVFTFWDEWGGFYDHVPPPQIDATSYGFRVPLIVISPYTKVGSSADGGYISHTLYSAQSVLKFVQDNWSLPALTPKVSAANDMMDMFNFSGSQRRPALQLTPRTCPKLNAAEQKLLATRSDD